MVFVVNDALGGFGDGNNLVGEHKTFIFDLVDKRVADMHTSTVIFGSVDMGD